MIIFRGFILVTEKTATKGLHRLIVRLMNGDCSKNYSNEQGLS
jgi:hypothetical protein